VKNKSIYGGIGSVSSGTMRKRDLISTFLLEAKFLRLTKDERKEVRHIDRRFTHASINTDDAYWQDEISDFDLEELFSVLNAHSLPYFSFGSHEGDGADYGWWLPSSFDEDFDGLRVSDTSEVPRGYTGEVLHVNDHGNITLYSYSRGRSREVWGVV
jgi:hypothetical protein